MSRKKSEHTDTRQNTSAAMRPRKCKPCKVLNIEWNIAASVCVKNMFVARQRKNIYTNRDQFCTEICFTYTLQFFVLWRNCWWVLLLLVECCWRRCFAWVTCHIHSDLILRVHFDNVWRRDALLLRIIAFVNSQNESGCIFFCLFEFTWVFFKCNSSFFFLLLFKQIGFVFINFAVDRSKLYTMRIGFYSNIHRLFTKISNKKWIWKFTLLFHKMDRRMCLFWICLLHEFVWECVCVCESVLFLIIKSVKNIQTIWANWVALSLLNLTRFYTPSTWQQAMFK